MIDNPPTLTWAFDLQVEGDPSFPLKATESSSTCCAHVTSGTLTSRDGSIKLVLRNGSDWMTLHDGYIEIDARISCESEAASADMLNIDLAYQGRMQLTPQYIDATRGTPTDDASTKGYYYTTVYLHSRSQQLAWVNSKVFIASAELRATDSGRPTVLYRIYQVG